MARDDGAPNLFDLLGASSPGLNRGSLIGPKDYPPGGDTGGSSPPIRAKGIPPEGAALLRTIGGPGYETNGNYAARYRQPDITDFSKHPGTFARISTGPNQGKLSNSAGRYQFISTTWADRAKAEGLTDFSPESQDKAAWSLAQKAYADQFKGRDLAEDLKNPAKLPDIASALSKQWSSLPGGVESGGNMARFASTFARNLEAEGGGQQTKESGVPNDPWMIRMLPPSSGPTLMASGGSTI